MQIKGKNLILVWHALGGAIAEVHNLIATCPDVNEYFEDIEDYARQKKEYEALRERVAASIEREA
jgi:hypothetical protein